MIIHSHGYPRAGLIGNPSDGYFGKTISFTFSNFAAEVILYQSPELEITPNVLDSSSFANIHQLVRDVGQFGYYGGVRLLKAAVKRFYEYCRENGVEMHDRNFTLRYHSDIPRLVGLAGSSAIITACMRALMSFYGVSVPHAILANLVLSVERDELGISAGLQDRVAQAYQGLMYMDFNENIMRAQGHGRYERLDPSLLPPLYIAYRQDLAEGSEVFHNDIRGRFNRGDPEVLDAIRFWIELTDRFRAALAAGRREELAELMNANFDRRLKIYKISEGNIRMVDAARSTGASAKFTGSGGAIVGSYTDEAMFKRLKNVLEPMNIRVIKPVLADHDGGVSDGA